MAQGSYTVHDETASPPRRDTSFKSFICALLVFLTICLIILLATINWGGKKNTDEYGKDHLKGTQNADTEIFNKSGKEETKNEKIVVVTVPQYTTKFYLHTTTTARTSKLTESTKPVRRTETTTTYRTVKLLGTNKTSTTTEATTAKPRATTVTEGASTIETSSIYADFTQDGGNKLTATTEPVTDRTTTTITEASLKLTKIPQNTSFEFITTEDYKTSTSSTVESTTEAESQSTNSTNDYNGGTTTTPTTAAVTTTSSSIVDETDDLIIPGESDFTRYDNTDSESTISSTETNFKKRSNIIGESTTPLLTTRSETKRQHPTSEQVTKSSLPQNVSRPRKDVVFKNSVPVCRTSACNLAASRMLSLMNHSASPCEDFYDFACGGAHPAYLTQEEFADSKFADALSAHLNGVNNSTSKYLNDFKLFYRSCVEYEDIFRYRERIKFVKNQAESFGGFHVETESANYDLTDLFINLLQVQSMPLFEIGLDVDQGSSNFIIQLTVPHESFLHLDLDNWSGLSLHKAKCLKKQTSKVGDLYVNLNGVYEAYTNCGQNHATYLNSIENVLRQMNIFPHLNDTKLDEEITHIRFTIEFDVLNELENLPRPDAIRDSLVKRRYARRKVSDLQAQYPVLNWKKLLGKLSGHDVEDNAVVQVYFEKYFTGMFKSLANVDRRKLRNALLSIYVHDLFINTVIPKQSLVREEYCQQQTVKLFPDVTSHLMGAHYENDKAGKKMRDLFAILKRNFCSSLKNSEWLDDESKTLLLTKCDEIDIALFTSPIDSDLESNYENFALSRDYQTNLIDAIRHFRRQLWSKQGTKFNENLIFSYFLSPFDRKPTAFYFNEIIAIPPSLLNQISDELPGYLTMADVGLKLAREIARKFDPTSIEHIVLSSSSRPTYNHLIATTINMMDYSSPRIFDHQNITFKINGSLSANDRITDSAAFRLVLDSFEAFGSGNDQILPWISSSYSREKIVYIAAAQAYCEKMSLLEFMLGVLESNNLPPPLKVENIMGNSESFAEKFSCPEGSGMTTFPDKLQFPYLSTAEDDEEEK